MLQPLQLRVCTTRLPVPTRTLKASGLLHPEMEGVLIQRTTIIRSTDIYIYIYNMQWLLGLIANFSSSLVHTLQLRTGFYNGIAACTSTSHIHTQISMRTRTSASTCGSALAAAGAAAASGTSQTMHSVLQRDETRPVLKACCLQLSLTKSLKGHLCSHNFTQ